MKCRKNNDIILKTLKKIRSIKHEEKSFSNDCGCDYDL